MLSGNRWLIAGAAMLAAVVALVGVRILFQSEPEIPSAKSTEANASVPNISTPALNVDVADTPPQFGAGAPVVAADGDAGRDAGNDIVPFRADAAGELVLNEQTRLNIEALVAHTESKELYTAVREQTENLPPAAARRAEELVDKFVSYQQAQRQTYPPGDAPLTEEDAIRQLDGLHGLREAYFGPDVTRQFYGKEEALAREMIEVMRVENDQSLTAQEKLERAQALRERLPGVAAIEKANRDSAETQKQNEKK